MMRGWAILAVLAIHGPTGAAQTTVGAVEFHVKPGGVRPFTSSDASMRPQLGKPGKPQWATGGVEPGFWLSEGGTAERPFATLYQAQLAVRELLRTKGMPERGIRVVVHGGSYRLTQPLEFVPEDSGTPDHPVVYMAAPGEKPVLSGGMPIGGWKKLRTAPPGLPPAAVGHVWVAPDPEIGAAPLDFRQLYVNGRKAVRARSPNGDSLSRLLEWDIGNREAVVDAKDAGRWRNLKRVEMFLQQFWVVSVLRVESVAVEGARARITFQQPERDVVFSHPYPWPRNTDPYYFVNALEFLDEPGEWYLDYKAGTVYYWPRTGEDMATAEVVAPRLETLVRLQGSVDRPVHDINSAGWLSRIPRGRGRRRPGTCHSRRVNTSSSRRTASRAAFPSWLLWTTWVGRGGRRRRCTWLAPAGSGSSAAASGTWLRPGWTSTTRRATTRLSAACSVASAAAACRSAGSPSRGSRRTCPIAFRTRASSP
jgi:hypothetical protein